MNALGLLLSLLSPVVFALDLHPNFPRVCERVFQVLEAPVLNPSDPVLSIGQWFRKRADQKALAKFDRDYYRLMKVIYRVRLGDSPPLGTFEDNVAWFEVFLEQQGIGVTDFDEALSELSEKKRSELIRFYGRNPFSGSLNSEKIYSLIYQFFQIIEPENVLPSDLVGANSREVKDELVAREITENLLSNGLEAVYKKMGFLRAQSNLEKKARAFLNLPAVKTAKALLFFHNVRGVRFSSDEIDEMVLKGIQNRAVYNVVLKQVRQRAMQLTMVAFLFTTMSDGSETFVRHQEFLQRQREAEANASKILHDLDQMNQRLDEISRRYGE